MSGKFGDKDDNDGSYFIDRDPEYFKYLLRYLRYGHVQIPTVSAVDIRSEAEYYQIDMDFSGIEDYTTCSQVVVTNTYTNADYESIRLRINGREYDENSNVWKDANIRCGNMHAALRYAEHLVTKRAYRIASHSQGLIAEREGIRRDTFRNVYVLEKDIPQMIRIPLKKKMTCSTD